MENYIKVNHYVYAGINPLAMQNKSQVIINLVTRETGVTYKELKSKYRGRDVSDARALCMYFMRKYTNLSLNFIGDCFNKNHATVIHNIRKIENLKNFDSKIASIIEQIEYDLKNCVKQIGTQIDYSKRDELIGFYYKNN